MLWPRLIFLSYFNPVLLPEASGQLTSCSWGSRSSEGTDPIRTEAGCGAEGVSGAGAGAGAEAEAEAEAEDGVWLMLRLGLEQRQRHRLVLRLGRLLRLTFA